jgi:hypothetical protein
VSGIIAGAVVAIGFGLWLRAALRRDQRRK